jgi:hypothetical protein
MQEILIFRRAALSLQLFTESQTQRTLSRAEPSQVVEQNRTEIMTSSDSKV